MSLSLPAAYWCVLVAALLPYIWVGVAKWSPAYNNADPRELTQYQGYRRRAHSAQLNAFEALPFFIGAVALAVQLGGARGVLLDVLCVVWVLLRIGHGAAYLADRANLRSAIWVAALAVNIAIFLTPALT
jgi:uncharacterized MAPEG superfamily protein